MIAVLAVGAGVGEALEAPVALERSVSRVEASVLSQVVLVLESLLTDGAWVGSLI